MSLVSTKIARAHRLSDSHARPSTCAKIQCRNIGLYRTAGDDSVSKGSRHNSTGIAERKHHAESAGLQACSQDKLARRVTMGS